MDGQIASKKNLPERKIFFNGISSVYYAPGHSQNFRDLDCVNFLGCENSPDYVNYLDCESSPGFENYLGFVDY